MSNISRLFVSAFTIRKYIISNVNGIVKRTYSSSTSAKGKYSSPDEIDRELFFKDGFMLSAIMYCGILNINKLTDTIVHNSVEYEILGIVEPVDGLGNKAYMKIGLGLTI